MFQPEFKQIILPWLTKHMVVNNQQTPQQATILLHPLKKWRPR